MYLERRGNYPNVTINIVCNGNIIESKSTVTYLGVTLIQSLSGDAIPSDVLSKPSNKLKILHRNARKLTIKHFVGKILHVGANEFKTVGLLAVNYRVEQLKLGHMFNIINVKAPEYLRTNV